MEEALIARLRASEAVIATAGTYNARPAIDLHERKSDAETAFPAAVVSVVAPGKTYSQDGPDGLQQRMVRIECFGLSALSSIELKRAITAELERAKRVNGVQFSRSQLRFERSFPPEDLGALRVFRTLVDFVVPTSS